MRKKTVNLRRSPVFSKSAVVQQPKKTCFWLVEGKADKNFITYLKSLFCGEGTIVRVIPISGGDINLYMNSWRMHYNGEMNILFLFDKDLHPCLQNELPEDTIQRECKEILAKIDKKLITCICDVKEPQPYSKKKKTVIQGLAFQPCIEGIIGSILGLDIAGTSRQCKSQLTKKCAEILGQRRNRSDLAVEHLTPEQFRKILPKEALEDASLRFPELKHLIRLLQKGR